MENELDLTQEQIDNMTQEEWDNLPIVTGPNPSRTTPGIDGTINLSDEELKNPSTQKGPSPKLSAYKTPTVWEMKNSHGGIKPLNVRQSYEFDYDKHEDAALPQQEGGWKDVFKIDSAENIANKLIHGNQDSNMIGSSGPFGVIGGGGIKVLKGIYSAIKNPQKIKELAGTFGNTAKQYLKLAKGSPKADVAKKMTDHYTPHRNRLMKEGMAKDEVFKLFPTKDMMTPQHLANIAKAAGKGKPSTVARPTGGFKDLVTGNQVHTTKSVNDAFAKRFGKPSQPKTKYQKSYHENEILTPKSGYFQTGADGLPLPSNLKEINAAKLRAEKLKAARKITGKK